ncbi:MAG TPA: hypothetical protein DDW89_03795 [Gammaproteobacteria bacterium]|nr:hypothetical protein [Gammaproteobacteria bacterium]
MRLPGRIPLSGLPRLFRSLRPLRQERGLQIQQRLRPLAVAILLGFSHASLGVDSQRLTPAGDAAEPPFRWGLVAYHVDLPGYELTLSDIDRMADAGIRWLSIDLAWSRIQPDPQSPFDFAFFDLLVDAARQRGLAVVGKIGAGYNGNRPIAPAWTRNLDEADYLAALEDYAEATTRHFADRIHSFAVENEFNIPNVHSLIGWRVGVWTPDFMNRVMQTLAHAVHTQAPGAELIISVTPLAFFESGIERMNRLIDYDVVGIHTYPAGFVPDLALVDSIKGQIARARQASGGRPILILETGMHTEKPPWTETLQADYLEAVSQASRQAGAIGIFFYQYLDNRNEAGRERYFGLVTSDRTPKAAWQRYRSLIAREVERDAGSAAQPADRREASSSSR